MSEYTDIIVGAGSAGAVLAARLSEDPGRRVLLLEAGPDTDTADLPEDIRHGLYPSFAAHDWGYTAEASPGHSIPLARGKVVGGCSAINTSLAVRPHPSDFEEWTTRGLTGWSWDEVLPYLNRLEDDQDFGAAPHHGSGGPIPVRRWRVGELLPVQRAWLEACRDQGYHYLDDLNGSTGDGVGVLPQNLRDGLRISTAIGYLDGARGRQSLQLRPEVLVDRVVVEDGRATAVEYLTATGERVRVSADRIVLSAGAIGTPAILLRSGIGDPDELARLGVPVVSALPGVGRNLLDHPACLITLQPYAGVCDMGNPVCQILLRYTAPGSAETDDMQVYLYSQIDLGGYASELMQDADDNLVMMLSVGIERPYAVGSLTIPSTDPAAPPVIRLNFLDHPEDLRRMRDGVRQAWALAQHPELQKFTSRIVAPTAEQVASDEALTAFMLGTVTTHYHPVGTARMGTVDDPDAVVDDRCRVRGVPNLRVADGSVMPTMIHANTNLTCIAIGEKVADWMRRGD